MYRSAETDTTAVRPKRDRSAFVPVLRTYRQIAKILEARDGALISPARVREICQAAEKKIAHAFVEEPFHEQIVAILAGQEGMLMAPADVAELCESEGQKLVFALLADAATGARPGSGSARGGRDHGRDQRSMHHDVDAHADVAAFKACAPLTRPGVGRQS